MAAGRILTTVLLAAPVPPAAAETPVGEALARYVTRHDPGFTCSEREALGRAFLHCSHGPDCASPNLLFEIRDHTAIRVNGETGDFVDLHADVPVAVSADRPITYTASQVLLALGCPH